MGGAGGCGKDTIENGGTMFGVQRGSMVNNSHSVGENMAVRGEMPGPLMWELWLVLKVGVELA